MTRNEAEGDYKGCPLISYAVIRRNSDKLEVLAIGEDGRYLSLKEAVPNNKTNIWYNVEIAKQGSITRLTSGNVYPNPNGLQVGIPNIARCFSRSQCYGHYMALSDYVLDKKIKSIVGEEQEFQIVFRDIDLFNVKSDLERVCNPNEQSLLVISEN